MRERERKKDGLKKVHRPAPSAIYRIHERARRCYAHFTSRGQQLFPFYTLIEYGHVCGCGGARTQPDRDVSPAEFAFRTLLRCANQKSEMRPRDICAISGRSCNWIRRRAPYIINSLSARGVLHGKFPAVIDWIDSN